MEQIKDTLTDQPLHQQIPGMLNVLTILTYVGCGLGILSSIYSFFTICASGDQLEDMPEMGGLLGTFMENTINSIPILCDNRVIVFIGTLVAIVLCIVGASQMRQLKKSGFSLYVVGELLTPVMMTILLIGADVGAFMQFSGFIFPVIFVILYATQRKHLVN